MSKILEMDKKFWYDSKKSLESMVRKIEAFQDSIITRTGEAITISGNIICCFYDDCKLYL